MSGNAGPTNVELRAYCQRADAVVACFVRDVLQLREVCDVYKETSFWYLGTVPCRNVKLVGIIVGATVYERRTLYTLDDGTGEIQCVHQHLQPPKRKEKAPDPDPNSVVVSLTRNEIPKPLFEIGETVRITGRVNRWMDYRQIYVSEMKSVCPNEEPQHWINVSKLHQTYYSKPFIIPPLPPLTVPQTPMKFATSRLKTPSTATTLVTPSTGSSRVSSIHSASAASPPRLRHPARLRSKDHQASIFKMYLNHFIHSAFRLSSTFSYHDDSESETERDDYFSSSRRLSGESPTRRLRRLHYPINEEENDTPKPSRVMLDATPKPSGVAKLSVQPRQPEIKGFTLSYLRRVPELSRLAYAVVHREIKVRAREARRQEKEAQCTVVHQHPSGQGQRSELKEPTRRKVKRLFGWAIKELRFEGAIVVQDVDAPVWRGPPLSRGIWKPIEVNESLDKTTLNVSDTFSSSSGTSFGNISNELDEDQGELSDPPPNEESYAPLVPSLLYVPIEKAIQALCERKKRQILKERQSGDPGSGPASGMKNFSAPPGPTAEEIRKYLQQVDDSWMYVGEYTIKDALKELCAPGVERVQKMGERWKLTLGRYVA